MKVVYNVIGVIMVILGVIGIFLPVMPTIPFLLVASWCFSKGSKRFDKWFKSTTLYTEHLAKFEKDKTMKLSTKIKIVVPVTLIFLYLIYRYDILPMRIALIVLLLIKYYVFFFVMKNKPESSNDNIIES